MSIMEIITLGKQGKKVPNDDSLDKGTTGCLHGKSQAITRWNALMWREWSQAAAACPDIYDTAV